MHRVPKLASLAVAAALVTAAAQAAMAQQPVAGAETCTLHGGPTRSVVRVIDSETVLLDNHTEVRLIGAPVVFWPPLPPVPRPHIVYDRAYAEV